MLQHTVTVLQCCTLLLSVKLLMFELDTLKQNDKKQFKMIDLLSIKPKNGV